MSIMCHGSISRSIHPSHTPMDGDTIFAISTSDNSFHHSEEINKLEEQIQLSYELPPNYMMG